MTLQDFLTKAHDRTINHEHLVIAFKDLMRPSYSEVNNLNESDQDLVFNLIMDLRKKVIFDHIHFSESELRSKYNQIWEKRLALGLHENDLKDIKEIFNSFKAE